MADPKAPDPISATTEDLEEQQVSRDAIQVPAIYATTVTVMSTDTAVRIAFGEAVPGANKFHFAAAMDFEVAKNLQRKLGIAMDRSDVIRSPAPPSDKETV